MNVPSNIQPYWNEFQTATGCDASDRFYEVFHFADNERHAHYLAELVLNGTKRATASLLWTYEAQHKPLPKAGVFSVVTNWQKEPLCVIETSNIEIVPFEDVTESFAATEGEGDKTLRLWKEVHWEYFGRECERIGKQPSLTMPVVCESFSVVYPQKRDS